MWNLDDDLQQLPVDEDGRNFERLLLPSVTEEANGFKLKIEYITIHPSCYTMTFRTRVRSSSFFCRALCGEIGFGSSQHLFSHRRNMLRILFQLLHRLTSQLNHTRFLCFIVVGMEGQLKSVPFKIRTDKTHSQIRVFFSISTSKNLYNGFLTTFNKIFSKTILVGI